MDDKNQTKITFKSSKKQFRKRKTSSGSESDHEEESHFRCVLEDTKELQNLRRKPNGVSVLGLAIGKKLSNVEEMVNNDPFKMKTGGIVNMKNMKVKAKTGMEELDAVNLGNTFSAETNRRDEDADMMKYIDEELAKKKGVSKKIMEDMESTENPEDVLFQVPEHLRRSSSTKSEEMLSNQMLSGIPEVDLGIEERIRNIEATEDAKQKMLRERMTKKESGTSFVPTNMAVNFVQHNRFNIEGTSNSANWTFKKPIIKETKPKPVVVIGEIETSASIGGAVVGPSSSSSNTPISNHNLNNTISGVGAPKSSSTIGTGIIISGNNNTNTSSNISNSNAKYGITTGGGTKRSDEEKATDDFHFEKFKKQFRRY